LPMRRNGRRRRLGQSMTGRPQIAGPEGRGWLDEFMESDDVKLICKP
jgi:hypothetical protein